MIKPLLACLSIAIAAAPSAAQPITKVLEAVQGTPEIDRSTVSEDIGFMTDRHDRMTIPVSINGEGPFRFLIDTAADRTVVSSRVAQQLNLRNGERARLESLTGTSEVQLASVQRLQISRERMRSVDAPVLDAAHIGADGILGMDSLRSERVLFDFGNKSITIVPSAVKNELDHPDAIIVRGKLRNGHLIFTHAQARDVGVSVVIDTGAELTIGNSALRRRLQAAGQLGKRHQFELMSVTGQLLLGEAYEIEELEIGGVTMNNLMVVFADANTFAKVGLKTKPAVLLGMNAMRGFDKVSIDFAAKKLRVLLPEDAALRTVLLAAR